MIRIPGTISPAKPLVAAIAIGCISTSQADGIEIGIEPTFCTSYTVNSTPDNDSELTTTLDEALNAFQNQEGCTGQPVSIIIADSLGGEVINSASTGLYINGGDDLTITGNASNPPILESMETGFEGQRFFTSEESAKLTLRNLVINATNLESAQETRPLQVSNATLNLDNLKVSGFYTSSTGGALEAYNADVTITDTLFENNRATDNGGAINAQGSTLTIVNSTFKNNRSVSSSDDGGGAINFVGFNSGENLEISDSEFTGNSTTGRGGAISQSGAAAAITITDSIFADNHNSAYSAVESADIFLPGGAIYLDSQAPTILTGNTLNNNSVTADSSNYSTRPQGGAVFVDDLGTASITIEDNTFSHNKVELTDISTKAQGGAIHVDGGQTSALTISRNSFISNRSDADGGALSIVGASISPSLTNNTFAFNSSAYGGGALLLESVTGEQTTVAHNTFMSNTASDSGAAGLDLRMAAGTLLTLSHNVFAFNGAAEGSAADIPTLCNTNSDAGLSLTYTFVGGAADHGDCQTITDGGGNQIGTDEDTLNPGLGDLGLYGGSTATFLPKAGSSLVDAGDANIEGAPETDQRGKERIYNGGVIDLGAVERGDEVAPVVTVPGSGSGGGTLGAMLLSILALLGLRRKR